MKYLLNAEQCVDREIVRVIVEQIEHADAQLSDAKVSRVDAVHQARRAVKRARAALRLLRGCDEHLQRSNDIVLRDLGRSLSPFRDLDVAHAALEKVLDDNEDAASSKRIRACIEALATRRSLDARQQARYLSATAAAFQVSVGVLRDKLQSAQLGSLRPENLLAAARDSVRKARAARDEAVRTGELDRYHDLRKLTQRALNQAKLLQAIEPAWAERCESGLGELASLLGTLQDFVVVENLVADEKLDPNHRKGAMALRKLLRNEQKRLRKRVGKTARVLDNLI